MTYDLLVKNGRIVDGSGMPSFHGDVAVSRGKIVELGRLSGSAKRVIDAQGNVIAPGFIDNHCHYDAQVTWDPLCTFSCYHGATTVIITHNADIARMADRVLHLRDGKIVSEERNTSKTPAKDITW